MGGALRGTLKLLVGVRKFEVGVRKLLVGVRKFEVGVRKLLVGVRKFEVGVRKLLVGVLKFEVGVRKLLVGVWKLPMRAEAPTPPVGLSRVSRPSIRQTKVRAGRRGLIGALQRNDHKGEDCQRKRSSRQTVRGKLMPARPRIPRGGMETRRSIFS